MSAIDDLADTQERSNGGPPEYAVQVDDKGNLALPEIPERGDVAGLCAWLTSVFALDRRHPITVGERQGKAGPEAQVALKRASAAEIRFDPITRLNTPAKLIETLNAYMLDTDEAVPAFKGIHCRQVAYVVRMLCGATTTLSAADEAAGIVGTFLSDALRVEGHATYGTSAQRYEAAVALRREIDTITGRQLGLTRYLADYDTGEFVIRVGDLHDAARRHTGSSIPNGWLDARMENLKWRRIVLQGYGAQDGPGRGPHARCDAYRGHLPLPPEEGPVNT